MGQETMDIEAQTKGDEDHFEGIVIFKDANEPVTLKFVDIVYKIKFQKGGNFFGRNSRSEQKVILNGVTGIVEPGEMMAMLGPSGSGKTTLLTALGGRLGGMLKGTISYNAKPFSNAMRRNTGFVSQDDVHYPHLTVAETLTYTALLRLPNRFSKQEKMKQAEAVIKQLGLIKCKDSISGGGLLRGISGGERKRVSIGQELLINPSLLLLDEPTSGLDSTTAQTIISMLLEFAEGGRSVVLTIHQPSLRLFQMFHKLLLLSEGNPLYFGHASAAMDYFSSIGYGPSVAVDPSDFMLDLASDEAQEEIKRTLICAYKSNIDEKLRAEIREVSHVHPCDDQLKDQKFGRWATTWWQQFTILLQRGVKERKHESFSQINVLRVLSVALLIGSLWWQSDAANFQDQIGLLFLISVFWGIYCSYQAIFTFPQERMMLNKERSSGMYRLSSYFMSRTIADLPMEFLLPTAFINIVYWMVGLKPTATHFIYTWSVLLLLINVCQSVGLAIGALIMDVKSAIAFGSVATLGFSLTAGFYIRNIPSFVGWIKYVSFHYYAFKLLLRSQFKPDDTYPCGDTGNVCLVGDFPTIKRLGLGGEVASFVALIIMIVVYRLMAYLALMKIGVTKKIET